MGEGYVKVLGQIQWCGEATTIGEFGSDCSECGGIQIQYLGGTGRWYVACVDGEMDADARGQTMALLFPPAPPSVGDAP